MTGFRLPQGQQIRKAFAKASVHGLTADVQPIFELGAMLSRLAIKLRQDLATYETEAFCQNRVVGALG
ncbi:MAG: hypothetical protein QUV71_12070 [Rhizobium sp.]|nr:hypothetical protein [Rhizobium sp.]MDM8012291.1 hypothetical protein [Rhizobium sp.]